MIFEMAVTISDTVNKPIFRSIIGLIAIKRSKLRETVIHFI